ncbi:hypothetical protein [Actinomycetospora termitidis]|uniref:Uncharacterized protein n=1 Tax=Actinomycetospora termitidis TaxID=3053470 RepID=A0ABT7MCN9_9PSEU|nr:hypothetical protein [Actinomycetospora sp. Odt1-22]MDL5158425.1 hypothetical protein [Actinomycetospora sp. Odt1-22]
MAAASRGWVRPWVQLVEITVSAPIVIGARTARLVAGGWPPSARDRRELRRMVTEKASAFGQAGWIAVSRPPTDTARFVGDVLAPVQRAVRGNRRRLTRT